MSPPFLAPSRRPSKPSRSLYPTPILNTTVCIYLSLFHVSHPNVFSLPPRSSPSFHLSVHDSTILSAPTVLNPIFPHSHRRYHVKCILVYLNFSIPIYLLLCSSEIELCFISTRPTRGHIYRNTVLHFRILPLDKLNSCLIERFSAAHCKRLPLIPKNGIVLAPRMGHGAKAKYGCRDGYALKGNRYAECQFGNWSGDTPKCEEGNCEVIVGGRNTPVRRVCASLLNVKKPFFTVPR